ncbi:YhgE/Pip domain-containing protein [Ferdinandcohnia sp. Marseille-Q9671]
MKRIQKVLLVLVASTLVLPSFLVSAASTEGDVSSKDEVVYATLGAKGEQRDIYIVNTLDIEKAGKITDYGSYSSLKNLTDLSEIVQKDNTVEVEAKEGKFYYQGLIKEKALPWDISVAYVLDGKEIEPQKLAGKEGHIEIQISTSKNEEVNPVFFSNYLLQISLTLDPAIYSNIHSDKGMLANAGKNKQVTFTVMPEKEEELALEADVVDFELEGINITAVPSSMSIDVPDIDDMTGDMETLTDAIEQLHDGVSKLKNGVTELNSGVSELRNGSGQFKNGMTDISKASSGLVSGSNEIDGALQTISESLSGSSEEMNLGELAQLSEGLAQTADGLRNMSTGLGTLKENYAIAYTSLDQAMGAIPNHEVSEADFKALSESGANQEVLNKLKATYSAAMAAKETYSKVKQGFAAVDGALQESMNGLGGVATKLDEMANGLSASLEQNNVTESLAQLQKGIGTLATNYRAFHSGLVEYTNGVGTLSSSYQELHNGIVEFSQGTGELEQGVGELQDGTGKLYEATSDLPDQMKEEVDEMISEFDKSDFEAVSFVSDKNENVTLVQFVLKTESIQLEEPEEKETTEKEEKGFWARLMDLFK